MGVPLNAGSIIFENTAEAFANPKGQKPLNLNIVMDRFFFFFPHFFFCAWSPTGSGFAPI
jgi:hypothetical protein